MLAKIIVTGADRRQALEHSRRALRELEVGGLATVVPFHRAVVDDPAFAADTPDGFAVHTRWIETEFVNGVVPAIATDQADDLAPDVVSVVIGGRTMAVHVPGLAGIPAVASAVHEHAERTSSGEAADGSVTSPMQGTVVKIDIREGDQVNQGDILVVVEAMKMENPVRAPRSGTVAGLAGLQRGRQHQPGRALV